MGSQPAVRFWPVNGQSYVRRSTNISVSISMAWSNGEDHRNERVEDRINVCMHAYTCCLFSLQCLQHLTTVMSVGQHKTVEERYFSLGSTLTNHAL